MKVSICLFFLLSFGQGYAETAKHGAFLGAKASETPSWFKDSFLEFEDDVAEAAEKNKRIMLYFHQQGCPYCARLVEENFTDPAIEAYVKKHFEGIEINMWGDREVISIGGKHFTEKTFAAALKVQYTPTLLFLDEQGKVALRINGYYPPDKFRLALRYVADRQESRLTFNEYVSSGASTVPGGLIREDFYLEKPDLMANLTNNQRYLAVYFESSDCRDCEVMHKNILTDAPTRKLVMDMVNVQLNIHSNEEVIDTEGERLSQRDYAKKMNIGYTPAVVFFDGQGKEVHRIEGFLKTFHFQSSLAYVLEEAYRTEPSFQRYISARSEKLIEQGYDTDIWGYSSSFTADIAE